MNPSITAFGLWSVWQVLSLINKALLLLICGVSIYTLVVSLQSLFIVHSLRNVTKNPERVNRPVDTLRHRLWNLRQLHLFSLYFFGFCIVFQIPGVFHTVAISYDLPPLTVVRTLAFLCYFDATIFLIFLLIHSVQWFASARVDSLLRNHD